jgi:hypothetical protein
LARELTPDDLASCCFALVAVMQDERLAPGCVPLPPTETPRRLAVAAEGE